MTAIPARRPGIEAQVGDIVTSRWRSGGALWRVLTVHEIKSAFGGPRQSVDLESITSGRKRAAWTGDIVILSPEEVARIQAKRKPKELPADTLETIAEAIARWDYRTATGEEPDSDEGLVLPPHREIAGTIGRIVTGGAA